MNNAMFVITHKNIENKINLKNFYYLGVGNEKLNTDYLDSSDENISQKNKNYCELTGLYWIWKNVKLDEVGLCHYRRFFCKKDLNKYELLNIDELHNILNKADIVIPKKINVYMDYITYYEKCLRNDSLRECCKMISKDDEEIKKIINKILNKKEYYCFNMFYCKKEILDEYCEWLFEILFKFENKIDINGWSIHQQRVFGFISEFLLNVWIEMKKLKIVEIDVAQSEKFPVLLCANAEKNVVNPNCFQKLIYKFLPLVWPFLSKILVKKSLKEE